MTEVTGISNWQLTVCRKADSMTILRAATCDRTATIPEMIFGLPVTEIADHAFAAGCGTEPGEQIQISHGISEGKFDNSRLEKLTFPKSLKRIENYALMRCRALRTLVLWDGISYFGAGIFINCRNLSRIELTRENNGGCETFSYLVRELTRELDITVNQKDEGTLRLIFPEYYEKLTENEPTHFFNYTIEGGGYAYHNVFERNTFDIRKYDSLWEKYVCGAHDNDTALRLAWFRIRYPVGLSATAEEDYIKYLQSRLQDALGMVIGSGDSRGLQMLLKALPVSDNVLTFACDLAREEHQTEILALLLERQHRTHSETREKRFEL